MAQNLDQLPENYKDPENTIKGNLDHAKDTNIAILVAEFNRSITAKLLIGATKALEVAGTPSPDIFWVPGAFELPLIAQNTAGTNDYDAIICLGCVIRGDTPHFDYVCQETARGIMHVSLKENLPVIFGVLTTNTLDQALERAAVGPTNKGHEAAIAALKTASLI